MPHLEVFEHGVRSGEGDVSKAADPARARFAGDLAWLRARGIEVDRYNLDHDTGAAAESPIARQVHEGVIEVPVLVLDGHLVACGEYPPRERLAELAGLEAEPTGFVCTQPVKELIGLSVAVVQNDEDSFTYYFNRARRLQVRDEDIYEVMVTALVASDVPAREVMTRVAHFMVDVAGVKEQPQRACCG